MELRSKRVKLSSPLPRLPPEVWEQVFDNLIVHHLKQVRLTCRLWKQIVDESPTLRAKILLKFPRYETFGQDFEPTFLYPASKALFRWSMMPTTPGLWWTSFASRLTWLRLEYCSFSLQTLLSMLRHAPSLKQLILKDISLLRGASQPVDVSRFQLGTVERLELLNHSISTNNILLEVSGDIFPQIKHFATSDKDFGRFDVAALRDFIAKIRHSLKVFEFEDIHDQNMQQLFEMDLPRLKRVSLRGSYNSGLQNIISFLQRHPTLEDVTLLVEGLHCTDLCDVGRNLPLLKRLVVWDKEDDSAGVPLFLGMMPHLEELEYHFLSYSRLIDFRGITNPNLKSLSILDCCIQSESFTQYLRNSNRLRTLSLAQCNSSNWPELLSTISQMKSLEHLTLKSIAVHDELQDFPDDFAHLRTLTLERSNLKPSALVSLFQRCPNLEELKFLAVPAVDDEVFRGVCRGAPRLRKLHLGHCSLTDLSAEYILRYCHGLQLLVLEYWYVVNIERQIFSGEYIRKIHEKRSVTVMQTEGGVSCYRYP